jgi:hypothetical protein
VKRNSWQKLPAQPDIRKAVNCRVCGRQFDPTGFQILVPGLKLGFDRVECALEASAPGVPPERADEVAQDVVRSLPTAVPVPALAGGPVLMAGAAGLRPQALAGANLAVLAAGTAATIYLWLRVFGLDLGPISFPGDSASPAFERSTVAATIDLTPASESRPQPESMVRGGGSQLAFAPPTPAASDSDRDRPKTRSKQRTRRNGGPVVRPSPQPPPPPPPAEPTPVRSAPVPTVPVPSSPPADRIPGRLPGGGGGANPEQPTLLTGGGTRG